MEGPAFHLKAAAVLFVLALFAAAFLSRPVRVVPVSTAKAPVPLLMSVARKLSPTVLALRPPQRTSLADVAPSGPPPPPGHGETHIPNAMDAVGLLILVADPAAPVELVSVSFNLAGTARTTFAPFLLIDPMDNRVLASVLFSPSSTQITLTLGVTLSGGTPTPFYLYGGQPKMFVLDIDSGTFVRGDFSIQLTRPTQMTWRIAGDTEKFNLSPDMQPLTWSVIYPQ